MPIENGYSASLSVLAEPPRGKGGMTPMLIPFVRSAHDQNVLARLAQWGQQGCHSKREKQASLEG